MDLFCPAADPSRAIKAEHFKLGCRSKCVLIHLIEISAHGPRPTPERPKLVSAYEREAGCRAAPNLGGTNPKLNLGTQWDDCQEWDKLSY